MVRVYIEHGDRTDRTKARLKYVLDKWVSRNSSASWRKYSAASSTAPCPARWRHVRAFSRTAHIGIHPQKQDGLHWIGVVVPVGR